MTHTATMPSPKILAPEAFLHPERIVAVIPAFNEERFVASVVFKARRHAGHVIVVDDGSTDHTAELAAAAGAEVVVQPRNLGKAEALNAGFRAALRLDPQAIVCLDADAQHDAAEIPEIVKPVLGGHADVVVGSRFLATKSRIPAWRQVGQHTLTAVTNTLSNTRLTDSQSGFRAFSPTAARALRFSSQGLSVESEMQFLFGPAGLRIVEAPISVQYLDGNKRNPIVHGMNVLDAVLGLVARKRPLLFLVIPGMLLGVLGILLGVHVIWTFEATKTLMVGSAVLTTLLTIGGLSIALTGVMLHSVGHVASRIREELKDVIVSLAADPSAKI